MNKTKIEWVKNPDGTQGYTWNPITGCLNHTDGMCKGGGFPCYAYKLAHGRLKQRYLANTNIAGDQSAFKENVIEHLKDPFYPRFWTNRIYDLRGDGEYEKAYPTRNIYNARREKEKGIFVCDMSDLFGNGVPEGWTRQILEQIRIFSQHRFYLLTKQPQNLKKFSPFPENCFVGVTATDYTHYDLAIEYLANIKATVKYISFEPLLFFGMTTYHGMTLKSDNIINWLIIGACTGTEAEMEKLQNKYQGLSVMPYGNKWTAQPQISWIQEINDAADKVNIPIFEKNNLVPLFAENEITTGLRQEFPK